MKLPFNISGMVPSPQTKTVGNTVYTMFTVEKSGVLFFSSLEEMISRLTAEGVVDFKITPSGDRWIVTAVKYLTPPEIG